MYNVTNYWRIRIVQRDNVARTHNQCYHENATMSSFLNDQLHMTILGHHQKYKSTYVFR